MLGPLRVLRSVEYMFLAEWVYPCSLQMTRSPLIANSPLLAAFVKHEARMIEFKLQTDTFYPFFFGCHISFLRKRLYFWFLFSYSVGLESVLFRFFYCFSYVGAAVVLLACCLHPLGGRQLQHRNIQWCFLLNFVYNLPLLCRILWLW